MGELQAIPAGFFDSMADATDRQRAEFIAESERKGYLLLQMCVVPAMPAMAIELPFSDPPAYKLVELPYETREDEALVKAARQTHADLIAQFGENNVLAVKPSLEMALRYGHLYPNDLIAFMVNRMTVPELPL